MANKKTDLGAEAGDVLKDLMSYVGDHFIQLVVVAVSATQTYYLVSQIAPRWAMWLPGLGVLLMEGGYMFWMWREFEADIADGSLKDIEKNAQERIANRMVYITLGLSVLTMLAGGLLEIAQSDLLELLAVPVWANVVALIAISGIFVLAGIHLFADWRYRRADPDVFLERDHRKTMRELRRKRDRAAMTGEEQITDEEIKTAQGLYNSKKEEIGRQRAQDDFGQRFQVYALDEENPTPPPRQ
jgi:hypothetical protein